MKRIQDLLDGQASKVPIRGCAPEAVSAPERLIFSGSFSPWHEGHRRIAEIAARHMNSQVDCEVSIVNVDKPSLGREQILDLLRQFPGLFRVWLTRAPTFVEKSELFPAATFVVGVDTIQRIADPQYYGGSRQETDHAIRTLADSGCQFLVFGRLVKSDFQVLSDLDLPTRLHDICDEIAEDLFRVDISSTEIRDGCC
jgi:hypothetical protein